MHTVRGKVELYFALRPCTADLSGLNGMYINFWYPVCLSDELTGEQPQRVKILGLRFVTFRDASGNAHVLADTCVHRGGSLGKGKISNGRVACPYHGWEFDGSGRCAHIPSLQAGRKIAARAKVDSYPVVERYGIVFAFLGDLAEKDRPALYEIAEWERSGWRATGPVILELDAYFERSIENGLDPVHNEFVHDLQGNIRFRPDRMTVSEHDWGTEVFIRMDPPKPGTTQLEHLRNDDDPEHFGASSAHYGPNTLVTTINLSKDNTFVQYFFEQPVDESHTRIFFLNLRNCMLDESSDERLQKINLAIAAEDIAVVTELYPVRTPASKNNELLVIGDECISGYRNYLKKWTDAGWRIDWKTSRSKGPDTAYAIPSPGRRESGNWVLDSVPMVPGRANST
jgi:phenylpropionate dioxygenase-like ring-hydroxylating dioxygenase large terminal subunit